MKISELIEQCRTMPDAILKERLIRYFEHNFVQKLDSSASKYISRLIVKRDYDVACLIAKYIENLSGGLYVCNSDPEILLLRNGYELPTDDVFNLAYFSKEKIVLGYTFDVFDEASGMRPRDFADYKTTRKIVDDFLITGDWHDGLLPLVHLCPVKFCMNLFVAGAGSINKVTFSINDIVEEIVEKMDSCLKIIKQNEISKKKLEIQNSGTAFEA